MQHKFSQPVSHSRDKSPTNKHEFKQIPTFDEAPKFKTVFRENQVRQADLLPS